MKLIIGLGNPGKEYEKTRHNVGYMALDKVLGKIPNENFKWRQRVGAAVVETRGVVLAAPQRLMNRSGQVVRDLQKFYDFANEDMMIICDDLDLSFSSIRVRQAGSAGSHNGLKSIIELIGEDFWRLKIGIKNQFLRDASQWSDFVLSPFGQEEKERLPVILDLAAAIVLDWVSSNSIEEKTIKI